MPTIASTKGKGWLKDLPDFRDYTPNSDQVSKKQEARGVKESVNDILSRVNPKSKRGAKEKKLSTKADLRNWCSPVEDQGALGSCTAHAGVGLYEYFEKRAFGKYIDGQL